MKASLGFMPRRTITDSIIILGQTIEKHGIGNKDIWVTFIDLEQYYDLATIKIYAFGSATCQKSMSSAAASKWMWGCTNDLH